MFEAFLRDDTVDDFGSIQRQSLVSVFKTFDLISEGSKIAIWWSIFLTWVGHSGDLSVGVGAFLAFLSLGIDDRTIVVQSCTSLEDILVLGTSKLCSQVETWTGDREVGKGFPARSGDR